MESDDISSKMWDEITYPFSNFRGATVEVLGWISNLIPRFIMVYNGCGYLSMLGFKLNHADKGGLMYLHTMSRFNHR